MSDALYERYKEALRAGHVASLRGRQDAALGAYVEAATLAPERALPHVSIGQVYLRLERPTEALSAFDAALERAPDDEKALDGRAEALAGLGRPVDAADTLDRASALQLASGRILEALDSACRALDLAESRPRRHAVEDLVGRAAPLSSPEAAAAIERAHRLLEARLLGPDEEPPPPPPDPFALVAESEDAIAGGRMDEARDRLLAAARAFAMTDRPVAGLDACYSAIALAPDDPELHLTLASFYLDRGWRVVAAEKLVLLGRLAGLSDDPDTLERARSMARERLPDEPRVATLFA